MRKYTCVIVWADNTKEVFMKRIIICDDKEKNIVQLRGAIEKLFPGEFFLNGYVSDRQIFYEIEDGFLEAVTFVFLNLDMKGTDSIAFAGKLQKKLPSAKIIFIAEHLKRVEEIFDEVSPFGLLCLPLNELRLEKCIRREEKQQKGGEFVKVNKQGRHYHILADDIFYVESRGRKLGIHREKETDYVYERISNFCDLYQKNFIRCHQSYAINQSHVIEISTKGVILKNGVCIPVSRKNYQDVKMRILYENNGRKGDF